MMWSAIIFFSYFVTFFQYTLLCTCNNKAVSNCSNNNHRGEIENPSQNQKRQLEFNDYNPTEFIVEDMLKGEEVEISGLIFNDTFSAQFKNFIAEHDANNDSFIEYDSDQIEISNHSTGNFSKKTLPTHRKGFEIHKIIKKPNSTKEENLKVVKDKIATKSPAVTLPTHRNIFITINNSTQDDIYLEDMNYENFNKDQTSPKSNASNYSTIPSNLDTISSDDETTVTEFNFMADIPVECKKYKKTLPFSLNNMTANWQIAYYTMSTRLKCFSIYIRSLSNQEQRRYAKIYGDFNNSVLWNRCYLEITSNDNNKIGFNRKHFLQGSDLERGVLKNIIIDEERSPNLTTITLQYESPDQWLVVKNILLMRDCNTGHLAIFTRVPTEPTITDIEEALRIFGEPDPLNGTRACLKTSLYSNPVNSVVSSIL